LTVLTGSSAPVRRAGYHDPADENGKVKLLAINAQGFHRMPEVPTVGEVIKGHQPPSW
jgi:hypothetical protein